MNYYERFIHTAFYFFYKLHVFLQLNVNSHLLLLYLFISEGEINNISC